MQPQLPLTTKLSPTAIGIINWFRARQKGTMPLPKLHTCSDGDLWHQFISAIELRGAHSISVVWTRGIICETKKYVNLPPELKRDAWFKHLADQNVDRPQLLSFGVHYRSFVKPAQERYNGYIGML